MTTEEIEKRIHDIFEENYEALRMESGHALSEDVKQAALEQALLYYKKLRSVAEKVTDTEVKLSLPDQHTPKERRFSIDGVVDIVREGDEVWMYDIKTHALEYISSNTGMYEKQLNVYRHIWQKLRGQPLDHVAVISTALPDKLKEALHSPDEAVRKKAFDEWNPVIEITTKQDQVDSTVADFATVVDCIEENRFVPPPVKKLKEKVEGTNQLFGTRVCRNCDARFSCTSYREYALAGNDKTASAVQRYYNDFASDAEQEEYITKNLEKQEG